MLRAGSAVFVVAAWIAAWLHTRQQHAASSALLEKEADLFAGWQPTQAGTYSKNSIGHCRRLRCHLSSPEPRGVRQEEHFKVNCWRF